MIDSSQFRWCSVLMGRWTSPGPISDLMIFGSLAARAVASLSLATGSLPVTRSSPRETKIQPLSPMNLMPFGKSPLTIMCTPFA